MGKRADCHYPTSPMASDALRRWLRATMPQVLTESWIDPAAADGLLLDGLGLPTSQRYAIELHARHRAELARRVPSSHLTIGDGLAKPWLGRHVAMNPPFDNEIMTAFVARALERQATHGGLVVCLALATWWHSDAVRRRGAALRRPTYVLVPDQRVSCDGSGRGDMRAIDWLVWQPGQTRTEVVWLPPAAPAPALIAEHRRLASQGAAS